MTLPSLASVQHDYNTATSVVLRDYQERDLCAVRQLMRSHRSVLLVQPCGSGKGTLASVIVKSAAERGNRSLFLVNRRELVKDMSRRIARLGIDHGIIMAGFKPRPECPVQIASVDTLHRRRNYPPASLLIVDEAHFGVSPVFIGTLQQYPDAKVLAMTATPIRNDGRGLGEICNALVCGPSVQELIDHGHLVPSRVFAPSAPDTSKVDVIGGEFNQVQLASVMESPKLVGDLVETWKQRANGLKTVVFAVHQEHARKIAQQYQWQNVETAVVLDDTPDEERDRIWDRFDNGSLLVIVSVGVISYGWDHPIVQCVQMARPTMSLALHLQQLGRGARPYPGKRSLLVLDHAANHARHGFYEDPREWTLDGLKVRQKPGEYCPSVTMCRTCLAAFRSGTPKCPYCGSAAVYSPRKIQEEAGRLEEMQREARAAAEAKHQAAVQRLARNGGLRSSYEEFAAKGKERGYRPGWAMLQFKAKHGFFPPKQWREVA